MVQEESIYNLALGSSREIGISGVTTPVAAPIPRAAKPPQPKPGLSAAAAVAAVATGAASSTPTAKAGARAPMPRAPMARKPGLGRGTRGPSAPRPQAAQ